MLLRFTPSFAPAACLLLCAASAVAASGGPITLRTEAKAGSIWRVEVSVESTGEVRLGGKNSPQSAKLKLAANFACEEKLLDPLANEGDVRAVRAYEPVSVILGLGSEVYRPMLRGDRRLIVAEVRAGELALFSPTGPLTREELDLLADIPADALTMSCLLPKAPVRPGGSWKHTPAQAALLFHLDAAPAGVFESSLLEVVADKARMQCSGKLEGLRHGAKTTIEVKGKYQFDLHTQRITWLGLLVRESQQPGEAEAGSETVSRIEVKVAPQEMARHLSEEQLAPLALRVSAALELLEQDAPEAGWRLLHDRRWHPNLDGQSLTRLRLIDAGRRIAQCNISPLPPTKPGKYTEVTQFQEDTRKALGKNFGEFVEAGQTLSAQKYRTCRVVVRGVVGEMPIEWRYYLIMDEQGHQAVIAFTLAQDQAEKLGEADRELVDGFRFLAKESKRQPAKQ